MDAERKIDLEFNKAIEGKIVPYLALCGAVLVRTQKGFFQFDSDSVSLRLSNSPLENLNSIFIYKIGEHESMLILDKYLVEFFKFDYKMEGESPEVFAERFQLFLQQFGVELLNVKSALFRAFKKYVKKDTEEYWTRYT